MPGQSIAAVGIVADEGERSGINTYFNLCWQVQNTVPVNTVRTMLSNVTRMVTAVVQPWSTVATGSCAQCRKVEGFTNYDLIAWLKSFYFVEWNGYCGKAFCLHESAPSCRASLECGTVDAKADEYNPMILASSTAFGILPPHKQLDHLDTIDVGVDVSRQGLGSGQYRWTVTFLDEGDDFELEDLVSRNFLNDTSSRTPQVTATKVTKATEMRRMVHGDMD